MTMLALPAPNLGNFQQRAPWEQAALTFLGGLKNPNTRRQYKQMLEAYLFWCQAANVDPMTVVKGQAQTYLTWLQDPAQNGGKGYSQSTIAGYWGVVVGFYGTAYEADLILKDPVKSIPTPLVDKARQKRPFLPPLAFAKFVEAAEEHLTPREYAIIAVLCYRALRISEACNLDLSSVGNERGQRSLSFIGKGAKFHNQPIAAELAYALDRVADGRTAGPLLLNSWGNRITRKNATDLIAKVMHLADLDKDFGRQTPHAMRRSFITYGLSMGMTLDEMCETVGHADPRTTKIYDQMAGHRGRDRSQNIVGHIGMMRGAA